MIHFIRGILEMKLPGMAIVETGGIGYEINIADNSTVYQRCEGEEVMLYTSMIVREDDVSLYGFANRDEMEMFNLLRTVSGVGAKASLAVLSAMPLNELKQAIAFSDAKSIQRANGIGKKTAERIVLDLKDKVGTVEGDAAIPGGTEFIDSVEGGAVDNRTEAVNALIALGYSKSEAIGAIAKVKGEGLSTEDYIKQALKSLF